MKSRYIIILFLIAAAGLCGAYYLTKNHPEDAESTTSHPKIVIPKNHTADEEEEEEEEFVISITKSYIDLLPTETLISATLFDFNNDTYEDEVDIIRVAGDEKFFILPALFNPSTSKYDRLNTIPTNVTRAGSVSVQGLDVIGNHVNSIIFQGIDDENQSVMQIYHYTPENEEEFKNIGDFISDVMVFIQQAERSEAYDFDEIDGNSHSVWIYKIDPEDKTTNPGQVQQEFTFNKDSMVYELNHEIKIPASRLAAKELSRIQDGSLETYGEFLTGLWCNTGSSKKRYIYFDFDKREIIQFSGDIQEVYQWGTSRVRHNGVYIYSVNTIISTLHRRIDVSLVNIDEVRLIIRDDVNLNIEAENSWDGYYKKQDVTSLYEPAVKETMMDRIRTELEKGPSWVSGDSVTTFRFEDHIYSMDWDTGSEKGLYSTLTSGESDIIQFRSNLENSELNSSYRITFGQKTVTRRGKERLVEDTDSVILIPVNVFASGSEEAGDKVIFLTRVTEQEE